MKFTHSQSGFTLLDMLLAVAIMGVLGAFSFPVYNNLFTRDDLDNAKLILVQSLRRAMVEAQAEDGGNVSWGVNVQNGSITVFQGSTYAGRTQSEDEVYPVPKSVTFSNFTASNNSYLTFTPRDGFSAQSATQSVTLTSPSGETRTVSVSPKGGMVDY